jgi:hypothetical protein
MKNPPAKTPGDFQFMSELNLTILLALPTLLTALLTATALLAALASGLLLLLTGLLLAAALLLAALLLPALLHITHLLVVRHGELSFAEGIRAEATFGRVSCSVANKCGEQECRNHDASTPLAQIVGAPGFLHAGARKMGYRQWPNASLILEQLRPNPARIADPC